MRYCFNIETQKICPFLTEDRCKIGNDVMLMPLGPCPDVRIFMSKDCTLDSVILGKEKFIPLKVVEYDS
jgi:hypothetical protein